MRINRLDGIRAIAILMVIGFHFRQFGAWLGAIGFTGVDLFFVLSGYFITGILRRARTEENYWLQFYTRRAARILPPFVLLLLVYAATTSTLRFSTILGYSLFAGNLMDLTRSGSSVLAPLWSLAVEEHFYLLWPGIVLLFSRRTLFILLSSVLLFEPVLRALVSLHVDYSPIYYLTPFRLDSLAAGSLLALLTEGGRAFPLQRWGGWIAFALSPLFVFFTVSVRDSNSLTFNALAYSFYAGIYFFFVAWVVTLNSGFFNRLLSLGPVAYLGRISYGMYLFQVPVHEVMIRSMHRANPYPWDMIALIVLSSLSFFFVEKPIMAYASRRMSRVSISFAQTQAR